MEFIMKQAIIVTGLISLLATSPAIAGEGHHHKEAMTSKNGAKKSAKGKPSTPGQPQGITFQQHGSSGANSIKVMGQEGNPKEEAGQVKKDSK